jgi:hypothetical protein
MYVIGHEYIGVNGALITLGALGQSVEIITIIVIGAETSSAIVTALDYVLSNSGKFNSCSARHSILPRFPISTNPAPSRNSTKILYMC